MDRRPLLRHAASMGLALRPAWWVLRAWVAVTVLDQVTGGPEGVTILPTLGLPGLGLLVVLVAAVGSALVGQGRWWPGGGRSRRGLSRVLLAGLNTVAVIGFLALAHLSIDQRYDALSSSTAGSAQPRGVSVDGRLVRNIYAYDAAGQPLTGVQLFDGTGRPIALSAAQAAGLLSFHDASGIAGCPWVNGNQRLYNVFPLPERRQPRGTTCQQRFDDRYGAAVLPDPPLSQVPPVMLPSASTP